MSVTDADYFLNRRRHLRIMLERHTVTYHHDLAGVGEGLPAETLELTRAAVVFLADEPLDEGTDLRLRIQVPFKQKYIRASGRVLGCDSAEDGRYRIVANYTKLLSGSDEALFDTLLELLSP